VANPWGLKVAFESVVLVAGVVGSETPRLSARWNGYSFQPLADAAKRFDSEVDF